MEQPNCLCLRVEVCPACTPRKTTGHNAAKSLGLPYPSGPEITPLLPQQRRGRYPVSPAPSQQAGNRLESDYMPRLTQLQKCWATGSAQDENSSLGTEIYALEENEDEAMGSNQVQMKFIV